MGGVGLRGVPGPRWPAALRVEGQRPAHALGMPPSARADFEDLGGGGLSFLRGHPLPTPW